MSDMCRTIHIAWSHLARAEIQKICIVYLIHCHVLNVLRKALKMGQEIVALCLIIPPISMPSKNTLTPSFPTKWFILSLNLPEIVSEMVSRSAGVVNFCRLLQRYLATISLAKVVSMANNNTECARCAGRNPLLKGVLNLTENLLNLNWMLLNFWKLMWRQKPPSWSMNLDRIPTHLGGSFSKLNISIFGYVYSIKLFFDRINKYFSGWP